MNLNKQNLSDVAVKFGQQCRIDKVKKFPGCFPVVILGIDLEINCEKVVFLGVEIKGQKSQGEGVTAYNIEKLSKQEGIVAWFRVEALINKNQFTSKTKEMVIQLDGIEVAREEVPECIGNF